MTALETATSWADLAVFRARMTANYLTLRARYAATIEADPDAWKERFWGIYGKLATTKALLMIARERIRRSPNADGAGNALLRINRAEAVVDLLIGTIKANLTDARTPEPAKPETGWMPVVLAIAGLGITVAAILWALAYEKDADAILTYSQTVDRETQRMTAAESARTLANANPGAPPPAPDAPKPPGSGNGAALVVGALTLAAAGGAVWWFSSSRK